MESEDEVDVEGDFDLSARSNLENVFNDFNEPPSKMALLQPEISQHPWTLEQGWSLDQCADEKSRAVIEKMLLEEQSYMDGTEVHKEGNAESSFKFVTESKTLTGKSCRRLWTEEEKEMFEKGVEIFGKKWSKIAELIPSRTNEQVKHYGYSYFRRMENIAEKSVSTSSKGHYAHSLKEMLTAVSTGQPTITTLPRKKCKEKSSKFNIIVKEEVSSKSETSEVAGEKFPESEVVRIQKQSDDESEEVNIEDEEDSSESYVTEPINSAVEIKTNQQRNLGEQSSTSLMNMYKIETGVVQNENKDLGHLEDLTLTTEEVKMSADHSLLLNNHLTGDELADTKDDEPFDGELNLEFLHEKNDVNSLLESLSSQDGFQSQEDDTILSMKLETSHNVKDRIQDSAIEVEKGSEMTETQRTDSCFELARQAAKNRVGEKPASLSMIDNEADNTPMVPSESIVTSNTSDLLIENLDKDMEDQEESQSDEDEFPKDFGVQGSDGKMFYLPNPVEEKIVHHQHISEEEKEIFVEFFDGRPGLKDGERYCKIRNYILDMWEESKPSFLYKTNIRGGLKKCGDVNVIGRIHAYLEQIGAINFGCDLAQYKVKKKQRKKKPSVSASSVQLAKYRKEALHQRRRKVRDMFGSWVDEKDKEGITIDHANPPKVSVKPQQRRNKQVKHQYDPFKLIPCQDFTTSVPAPFTVHMDLASLIVMDLHAHLSKTEVIGLLGGQYNSKKQVLEILMTEPCDSLSTGMQCEMDPVSQTEAKEKISSMNMQVVGWYHSHPTFDPNPSVRDIETQECLQEWFAVGKNPFVGVIVNPYSSLHNSMHSTVRSIIISRHTNKCANMGLPFQFHHLVVSKQSFSAVLDTSQDLLSKYAQYHNRVEMLSSFKPGSNVTCVDKFVASIYDHFKDVHPTNKEDIQAKETELKNLLQNLRNMVDQYFHSHI